MNITIMAMSTSMTMTMTSAAAMSMTMSIIMTTASAMTPTAPVMTITIITTPMRCSSPGVRKHPRCIHRLTALDSGDYGAILRAKGIVNGTDGAWIEFDYVPEEHEIRAGHPDYTGRLCVIGAELQEDKLSQLFGL